MNPNHVFEHVSRYFLSHTLRNTDPVTEESSAKGGSQCVIISSSLLSVFVVVCLAFLRF